MSLTNELINLKNSKDEDPVNLNKVLQKNSPLSANAKKISLVLKEGEQFPLDKITDNFIYYLKEQNVQLSADTWKSLVDFYSIHKDTVNLEQSYRAIFQILFVFSQLSVEELYKYNKDFPNENEAYNYVFTRLFYFISQWTAESVELGDEETVSLIKQFLKRDIMVESYRCCLKLVDVDVTCKWVRDTIDVMQIYFVDDMYELRGVTLMDGILIAKKKLPNEKFQSLRRAYLFTLAAHETMHFLVRFHSDDYNFSTPLKYESETKQTRFEEAIEGKKLELGRALELMLFDGVQPDWDEGSSSVRAAEEFLQRAKVKDSLPLIKKAEHKFLRLEARRSPSLSFAGYWVFEIRL